MRRAKLSIAILAASLLLLTASVGVASAHPRLLAQVVQLNGGNEVCAPPAVCGDPDGRGRAIIVIIPGLDLVCWHLSWRDIGNATAAHIHGRATPAQAAGIVVHLSVDPSRGCTRDAELGDILEDIAADPSSYYVNIHSMAFPAGAIRGQLR